MLVKFSYPYVEVQNIYLLQKFCNSKILMVALVMLRASLFMYDIVSPLFMTQFYVTKPQT